MPTWQAAQVQLTANSLYSSRNNRRHQYLLRGLVRCPRCGGTYTGYTRRGYSAYRCNRVHWGSSSTGQKCSSGTIPASSLEKAVSGALQSPETLLDGHRSLLETSNSANALEHERKQVKLGLKQTQAQEDRITQAYVNEAIELPRYKLEMDRLRARSKELEGFSHDLDRKSDYERDSKNALCNLESFCHSVADRLDNMSFEGARSL